MAKKPNLTTREKATMEVMKKSSNEAIIEAVLELNQLQEEVSNLQDSLYFLSLKSDAVKTAELTTLVRKYAEQVEATNKAIKSATKTKGKKVSEAVTLTITVN